MSHLMITDTFPCYTKDDKGFYVSVNQDFLDVSNIVDANDVIGITDESLPWEYNAHTLMSNDRHVIKSLKTVTFMEHSVYQGKPHIFRSIKSPLFGHNNRAVGVQCVSIPVSDSCLVPLTKQQTACLRLLAMGLTHKKIGQELGLSQKTVEHYLEAVKLKLNCETRSELIIQAIERGLISIF